MITPTNYRGYTIRPTPDGRAVIWLAQDAICTEPAFDTAVETIDTWVDNQKDS